jgi:hypothetical protein
MFKGIMMISSDPRFCFDLSLAGNNKIISLDEDDEVMELNPINNRNVVKGTILLPPIEAGWKEIDGDEYGYFETYTSYLSSPNVSEFITVLLATIYTGTNIIIYCPEFDNYVDDSALYVRVLYRFLENVYGIHIGTNDMDLFNLNPIIIPSHIIDIYGMGIIDPYTFLLEFGNNVIPDTVYLKLFNDINPFGNSYQEKKEYIDLIRDSIDGNTIAKCALISV